MTDVQKVVERLLDEAVPPLLPKNRERMLARIQQGLHMTPEMVEKLFSNPERLRKALQAQSGKAILPP